jgi:hypothetical protein
MKQCAVFLLAVSFAAGLPAAGRADTFEWAQVTEFVNDVKTIDSAGGAHQSKLNEMLRTQQSVRTGIDSRIELLFNDKTITRLGANTHFSYSAGTRNMSIDGGTMLLQVPKGIGGAKIKTPTVTASITGTTVTFKVDGNTTTVGVPEGNVDLSSNTDPSNHVGLGPGQSVTAHGGTFGPVVSFNVTKTAGSSKLYSNSSWTKPIDLTNITGGASGQPGNAGVQIKTASSLPAMPAALQAQLNALLAKYANDPTGLATAIAALAKANPSFVGQIVGTAINAEKNNQVFVNAGFECLVVKDSLAALKGPNGITDPAVIAGIAAVVADAVKDNSSCACAAVKDAIADLLPTSNPTPTNLAEVALFLADVVSSIPEADVASTSQCAIDAIKTKNADGTQITNPGEITTVLQNLVIDLGANPTYSNLVGPVTEGAVQAFVIVQGNSPTNADQVTTLVTTLANTPGLTQAGAGSVVAGAANGATDLGLTSLAQTITNNGTSPAPSGSTGQPVVIRPYKPTTHKQYY